MRKTRALTVALASVALVTTSCNGTSDPVQEEFCGRFVDAVRANAPLTGEDLAAANSPEVAADAAAASRALFEGAVPSEIADDMAVVRQYFSGEPGTHVDAEFLESYSAVRDFGARNCDRLTDGERHRLESLVTRRSAVGAALAHSIQG